MAFSRTCFDPEATRLGLDLGKIRCWRTGTERELPHLNLVFPAIVAVVFTEPEMSAV